MTIEVFLLNFSGGGGGVKMRDKMRDKMEISAYIFEKSEKGPILRPQMRAEDTFRVFEILFQIYLH